MRITVAFVLKLLASGMTHEEILKAYSELEEGDILQVIEYAAWLAESIIGLFTLMLNKEYGIKVYSGYTHLSAYR